MEPFGSTWVLSHDSRSQADLKLDVGTHTRWTVPSPTSIWNAAILKAFSLANAAWWAGRVANLYPHNDLISHHGRKERATFGIFPLMGTGIVRDPSALQC